MKQGGHFNQTARNVILYLILGVLVGVAFFLAFRAWENRQSRNTNNINIVVEKPAKNIEVSNADLYLDGKEYLRRKNLETVLIIGLDKFGSEKEKSDISFNNEQQADFLILMIIDHDSERFIPLHINRDCMVSIEVPGVNGQAVGTVTEQLALTHTHGTGGEDSSLYTAKAVSDFLYGIPIDHYVTFDMDVVAEANDLVGGVTLEILDDFSASDPSLIQGEKICLSGSQALHYVTARGSMEDSTNLARMRRQKQYLYALKEQAMQCLHEDITFAAKALRMVSKYMITDYTFGQSLKLVRRAINYRMEEIESIPGKAVKGKKFMEFYPDEQAVKELVVRLFYEPLEN